MPRIDDDADMNAQPNGRDPLPSELETMLERGLGPRDRPVRHALLSLQPTVLQPPPDGFDASDPGYSVSADDDIDLTLDDDARARRRQLLLAAAGVTIAILGIGGWLVFGPTNLAPPRDDVPTIAAPPPGKIPPVQVPPTASAPPAIAVAPAEPPQASLPPSGAPMDAPLGSVSNDLVPPTTDGLSPPRKVNAVRIIVENDREVRPAP